MIEFAADSPLEGMRFELLVPGKNVMSADADRGHTPAAAFGYLDEMNATEGAIAAGRADELLRYWTDRWLADCTLYGPAACIREGVEQWRAAGITTPVLVPLLPDGNQMNGLKAVFAAFER